MAPRILAGHVVDVLNGLPEGSIQATICSPPYWQLRSYNTAPQVWPDPDGRVPCADGEHAWGQRTSRESGRNDCGRDFTGSGGHYPDGGPDKVVTSSAVCTRCHAWRGELGQEPTVERYVANLVAVFRAVRRVLRGDGTLWVNLSGSFLNDAGGQNATSGNVSAKATAANEQAGRQDRTGRLPAGYWLKRLDYVDVPGLFAHAMQRDGWYWRSDIALVKCLSGGTRVYARTARGDGPWLLKDLVRMDPLTVKLWNGERWTQVLAWTKHELAFTTDERRAASNRRRHARYVGRPVEVPEYLEVEFRSGERVGCTPEHHWPTQRGLLTAAELVVGDVVPTVRLPESEDAHRPKALDDEEVGWIVGFYLAEGCRDHKAVRFSMHAKETAAYSRIERVARDFHGSATWQTRGNRGTASVYGRFLHAIVDTYISGVGAKQKHLAMACWHRSDAFLRAVLHGYLEGDGHWRAGERFWSLAFANNDELAVSLRTLAARLGARICLRRAVAKLGDREFPIYRGWLRMEPSTDGRARAAGEVVAIRASRARSFWDVTVEDAPHTFALASGVLTHNSAPLPESVQGTRHERCRVKVRPVARSSEPRKGASPHGPQSVGLAAANTTRPNSPTTLAAQAELGQWAPCPGCPRCAATDGWVLRRGNGRPTRSWERLLLFAKRPGYYFDSEALREVHSPKSFTVHTTPRKGTGVESTGEKFNLWLEQPGRGRQLNPAGRNARDWLRWRPEPMRDAVETVRRVRVAADAADGDTTRTVSPGCPLHGDRAGRDAGSIDGARASIAAASPRNPGSDTRLGPARGGGSASTSPDSCDPDPAGALAATSHSTPTHRTAPAHVTSPVGTPSAETPSRTGGTLALPLFAGPRPGTPENSTAPVRGCAGGDRGQETPSRTGGSGRPETDAGSPRDRPPSSTGASSSAAGYAEDGSASGPSARIPDHSADTSTSPACTCAYYREYTEKTQHYAAYPQFIPEFAIKAGTSERGACPNCGAGWARCVERERPDLAEFAHRLGNSSKNDPAMRRSDGTSAAGLMSGQEWNERSSTTTVAWRPTCTCKDAAALAPRPCLVLDPFSGSGTTLLVAERLGRDAIGIDLNVDYAAMAERRLELARAERAGGGRGGDGRVWAMLPLALEGGGPAMELAQESGAAG